MVCSSGAPRGGKITLGQAMRGVALDKISSFCRRWSIARLEVFGSALRDDFRSDSDLDLLATYSPQARWSLLDRVSMKLELEALLGRQVDLLNRRALEKAGRPSGRPASWPKPGSSRRCGRPKTSVSLRAVINKRMAPMVEQGFIWVTDWNGSLSRSNLNIQPRMNTDKRTQSCRVRALCLTCSQDLPEAGCRENRSLRRLSSSRFHSGTGNCPSSSAILSQRSSTSCKRSARPSLKIGANSVLMRQAYPFAGSSSSGSGRSRRPRPTPAEPNARAQAPPPEPDVGCNDDVQIP